jgi:hypothetical protein
MKLYSVKTSNPIKDLTSRFQRVLAMVYNTQHYWVFRLCPSSDILRTRDHNITETGFVSILNSRGDT